MNPAIRSVRYMGTFPQHRTEQWVMIGQDGGQSISVDGGTLFVFSDTLLAALSDRFPDSPVLPAYSDVVEGQGVFLANSAGLATGSSLREAWANIEYYKAEDGYPREILRPVLRERAQQIRFWPEHGICVDGRVYLYYLGIRMVDPRSIWGFETLGTGIATLDPATGECDRVWFDDDWRIWGQTGDDTHFAVQVLRDGDYVYAFGSTRTGPFTTARLARAPIGELDRQDSYEYLLSTKPSWGRSLSDAFDLGLCSSDYSVSYNTHLGAYLMVYVDSYDMSLMLRTALHLWGPYSDPKRITGVPREDRTEMVYLGLEHPEFSEENGKNIYISYCQPRFENNSLLTVRFR